MVISNPAADTFLKCSDVIGNYTSLYSGVND
jgi:hypothetical protein